MDAQKQSDIIMRLGVTLGKCDLYVNSYEEETDRQGLVARLPKSKRQAVWYLDNVGPLTSPDQQELVFSSADRHFCRKCKYLIGVHSHDQQCNYELTVHTGQVDFTNNFVLEFGTTKRGKVSYQQQVVFKFILDQYEDFTVTQINREGETDTYLALQPDKTMAFLKVHTKEGQEGETYGLSTADANFQTGVMYYLIIESNDNKQQTSDFSLRLEQMTTANQLVDGVPLTVNFENENDI